MLDLLVAQPSRLPEILKFAQEEFKYKLDDVDYGYLRQNILLDTLLDEKLQGNKKILADGFFLNISEALLGWHFNEFGSGKGRTFHIYNFDLIKSGTLMALRARLINRVYDLFQTDNTQIQKILSQIVRPRGDIDKTIYTDELPIYEKIISGKLDYRQYSHCIFVKSLAGHLTKVGTPYPEYWQSFIESEILTLSRFLKPSWEYRDDISFQESEAKKREEIGRASCRE